MPTYSSAVVLRQRCLASDPRERRDQCPRRRKDTQNLANEGDKQYSVSAIRRGLTTKWLTGESGGRVRRGKVVLRPPPPPLLRPSSSFLTYLLVSAAQEDVRPHKGDAGHVIAMDLRPRQLVPGRRRGRPRLPAAKEARRLVVADRHDEPAGRVPRHVFHGPAVPTAGDPRNPRCANQQTAHEPQKGV